MNREELITEFACKIFNNYKTNRLYLSESGAYSEYSYLDVRSIPYKAKIVAEAFIRGNLVPDEGELK